MKRLGAWIICLTWISSTAIPADAAYDMQVKWGDILPVNLLHAQKSDFASSGNLFDPVVRKAVLGRVLSDEDQRISSEFRIPPAARNAVEFWLRVYTEFTSQHIVIYDSEHPEVIYEVLDFRDLKKTARSLMVYEILSERRTNQAVARYRTAFRQLRANPRPRNPSPEQRNILQALKQTRHRHSVATHSRNLRTQTGQRDIVMRGLLSAAPFLKRMEQIFEEFDLPTELTRLSLVESSFNLKAVSKVGASGVWQFMERTGREFMTIEPRYGVDERLSPLKSTIAAARLLMRHKRIMKTWPLTITSYNHGFTGLKPLLARGQRARLPENAFSLCSGASRLGVASRNYYWEFLAMLHAEKYRDIFYGELPALADQKVRLVRVGLSQTALQVAMEAGVSLRDFKLLNPDIRDYRKRLPRGFWVAVPASVTPASMEMVRTFGPLRNRRG